MGVIPISIAIGIIEDKIANDLSSSNEDDTTKNKIIKHLEDVKNKISKTKHINKNVKIRLKNNNHKYYFYDINDVNINDKHFVIIQEDERSKTLINRDLIKDIRINDAAAVKSGSGAADKDAGQSALKSAT